MEPTTLYRSRDHKTHITGHKMGSDVLIENAVIQVKPSIPVGSDNCTSPIDPVSVEAVHRRSHLGVYATGNGVLFKNFFPMKESSDRKETLSKKFLGLRWSYMRNAYVKSIWDCLNRSYIDTAYWVTDHFLDSYYHWFCETYAKLFVLSEFRNSITLLLPHKLQNYSFITETLDLLDFERIIYIEKGTSIKIDNLFTIDHLSPEFIIRDDIASGISRLVRNSVGGRDENTQTEDRIYISRRLADKRRVLNERELHDVLRTHGFRVVVMEDLAFEHQVKLMTSCRYVVSAHGAGLTNMLFMEPGGAVLEFRNRRNPMCFVSLASALGHDHYSLCIGDHALDQEDAHWADVIIDPVQLDSALRQLVD